MGHRDTIQRSILPIPDAQHVRVTTYHAKDPDTKFPAIVPLRPPKGAPNVLIVLIDDCGFGATSAFGGPIPTPNAERLAANGLKFNRFHTTALCSPTRPGAAYGAQPSFREHGRRRRNRDVGPRLHLGADARHDAQAQWLLDGPVAQVSRSAGLGDEPAGTV